MKTKEVIDNLKYERRLYDEGYNLIAGIDEVGRGPLAGPVVASCVIMPKGSYIEGVTDSKKISPKKRKILKEQILEMAVSVSTIFIDEKVIEEINIYEATKVAMLKALNTQSIKPDYVLIDAMPLEIDIPHESIIKGDELSFSIACASIIAKEARDDFMDEKRFEVNGDNDSMDILSICEAIESDYKPGTIELTSYEEEQENNAIISYEELVKSKNGKEYLKVVKEETTEKRQKDMPSRLNARRKIMRKINKVKDSNGNITSHLSGIFFQTSTLISKQVKPIYVFDGKAPELKKKYRSCEESR